MQKAKKRLIPSRPPGLFIGISFIIFIAISRFVDGYSMELLIKKDKILDKDENTEPMELSDVLKKNEEINYRREEALENLQKIFGISGQSASKSIRKRTPPQFMTELYNAIADPSGVTRGKNPYNAKIVRSFVERDTLLSQLYIFNISGLEANESVIEAELHLFRKRRTLKVIHPTLLRSPYYLIRVYQVLEGQSMDEPDVHRLLNVHYVGAHASGWQVFNVKQAVLAWIDGAPNLGLLVTASTLFGDEASIDISRRDDDYHRSKQPILVLFDDDGKNDEETSDKIHGVQHYYAYNDDQNLDELIEKRSNDGRINIEEEEENADSKFLDDSGGNVDRRKRQQQDESAIKVPKTTATVNENRDLNREINSGTQLGINLGRGQEIFRRYKKIDPKQKFESNRYQSIGPSYFERDYHLVDEIPGEEEKNEKTTSQSGSLHRRVRCANSDDFQRTTNKPNDSRKFFVQRKTGMRQVLSSMDIYERAMLRQQIDNRSNKFGTENNERKVKETMQDTPKNYKANERKRFPREAGKAKETLMKSNVDSRQANTTDCTRHELYVDFNDIGLSNSIIAPRGYSAFHCQGLCDGHLTQDQEISNHAIMQGIVHRMGLVRDVHMPCCVPTKLLSTSILFFDDYENVVLKVYEDMIADRCGCR